MTHTPLPRWWEHRPNIGAVVASTMPLLDIAGKALLAIYLWYPLAQKPEYQPALIALALFIAMIDTSRGDQR